MTNGLQILELLPPPLELRIGAKEDRCGELRFHIKQKNEIEVKDLEEDLKKRVYRQEIEKLSEVFKDIDPNTRKLIDGSIQEAANLYSELAVMKEVIQETGLIQINPQNKVKQKALPIANEYRRTVNLYNLVIKNLCSVLNKNPVEQDDVFEKWFQEKNQADLK